MALRASDIVNFASKITWKRVVNAAKVWSSYQATRMISRPVHWGLPIGISFEPTTACNLRCPECPSGLRAFSRSTGNLRPDFFRATIDQIADKLMFLIFYFQGEPYINPDFLDMVRYAHSKGIYTITSTNAHFLNDDNARRTVESGLDRLIISIDGTTQEVYEQYRREGSLEKVLEGARNIVRWKRILGASRPHTIFQFLVVRPNEHQIGQVHALARDLGINEVKLKTAQIYDYVNGSPLIPEQERYARYAMRPDGTYRVKNRLLNRCWKLWHACVITWDGVIVPCCFDKDARHPMGDLKERDFEEIWHSGEYAAFRRAIVRGRDQIDICTNCTEGCKVWV